MSGDDKAGSASTDSVGVRERRRGDWGVPKEASAATSIYFRSARGTVAVGGCEWWRLRAVLADMAVAMLSLDDEATMRRLTWLLPADHRLRADYARGSRSPQQWRSVLAAHFRDSAASGEPALLAFDGRPIDSLPLVLNTALRAGGDALRLAARVYGQAAVHGWVDGPHRAWLADQVQQALDIGVFAAHMHTDTRDPAYLLYDVPTQWAEVIALLRSRDDEPVVMTTGGAFPDPAIADLYRLPEYSGVPAWIESADQWQAAMTDLRTMEPSLEMRPDTWDAVTLGHGLSVLDLRADDAAARIANALVEPTLVRVALTRHRSGADPASWSARWEAGDEVYDSGAGLRALPELVAQILDDLRLLAHEHIVVTLDWTLHGDDPEEAHSVRDAITITLPTRVLSDRVS